MTVVDIMVRTVRTCPASAMLSEAIRAMQQDDVGALPVLDEGGLLVGILTDRDAVVAVAKLATAPERIPVGQAVPPGSVWTVGPDATLAEAAAVMEEHRVRRLPVLDADGDLVGIVTLSDLAKHPGAADVAHALGAVSR